MGPASCRRRDRIPIWRRAREPRGSRRSRRWGRGRARRRENRCRGHPNRTPGRVRGCRLRIVRKRARRHSCRRSESGCASGRGGWRSERVGRRTNTAWLSRLCSRELLLGRCRNRRARSLGFEIWGTPFSVCIRDSLR